MAVAAEAVPGDVLLAAEVAAGLAVVGNGVNPNEDGDEEDEEDDRWQPAARPVKRKRGQAVPAKRKRPPAAAVQSRFVGVCWNKKRRKWGGAIKNKGRLHSLGSFDEDKAAARAFDAGARRLRGAQAHGGRSGTRTWRLNFPTAEEEAAAKVIQARSGFLGVSWTKKDLKWRAEINHEGQRHFLGLFAEHDAEGAARAYDAAAQRLGKGGRRYYFATEELVASKLIEVCVYQSIVAFS